MSGAAEWMETTEYPIISGDSSRGGMFEPKEHGGELQLQFFSKSGAAVWQSVWCELNGHCFNVYGGKADARPYLRFDLKECRMYPAVRGLPGKEINTKAPLFGVLSRYHRVIMADAVQDVPPVSIFFFECDSEESRDRWLTNFYINYEWAQRFSGLFYPRGTARVEYTEGNWKFKIVTDASVRYLKSSRLHVSAKLDGQVFKKGSKMGSAFKSRYCSLKGQCTLEYFAEKGGESLGKLNMSDGKVVLVCNDTLLPPTGAATKEKLSSLKGKITRRTSVAVPVESGTATKEEKQENLLWFAIVSPGRVWLFRAANLEDLERWMFSMEDRCNDFKQQMQGLKVAIQQAEKSFDNDPCPIRYRMHPLKDSYYPMLERAAIPGRPMSGQFSSEDAVRNRGDSNAPPMELSESGGPHPPVLKKGQTVGVVRRPEAAASKRRPSDAADLDSFDADIDALGSLSTKPVRGGLTPRGGGASPGVDRRTEASAKTSGGAKSPRQTGSQPLPPSKSSGGAVKKPVPRPQEDLLEDAFDVTGLDDEVEAPAPKKPVPAPAPRSPRSGGSAGAVSVPQKKSAAAVEDSGASEADEALREKVAALESLQKQFMVLKDEFTKKKLEDKKKEREIEQLKSDLEEAKANQNTRGGALEQEVEELKTQLKNEQKKTAKLEQQVKKLTGDNERLTSQAGAAKQAEEANQEAEELKAELEAANGEKEKLEQQVEELKKQLKETSKAGPELERERKKREIAERKLQTQEEASEKLEAEVESLKNELVVMEEKVATAAKQGSDTKEKKQLLQRISNLEAKLSAAESEVSNSRLAAAAYAQRKDYAGVTDQNVREVVKSLNEENDALMTQLSSLKVR